MKRTRDKITKYKEPSNDLSDLDLPDSDEEVPSRSRNSKMRKGMAGMTIRSGKSNAAYDDDEEVKGDFESGKYQGKT